MLNNQLRKIDFVNKAKKVNPQNLILKSIHNNLNLLISLTLQGILIYAEINYVIIFHKLFRK